MSIWMKPILAIHLPSVAGRQADIAALTAVRGLVFELRGKGPKSHKGVKALVHEVVKEGVPIERDLLDIFDEGFGLKVVADYGNPSKITEGDARRSIDMATRLLARIESILAEKR
ncbi:MAG TPA: HEPN domain-containing protein [Rhizomicrobium sp.]|jgi:uncharacterized protein (UPF0332 family)